VQILIAELPLPHRVIVLREIVILSPDTPPHTRARIEAALPPDAPQEGEEVQRLVERFDRMCQAG
jgi:hypothetical protein